MTPKLIITERSLLRKDGLCEHIGQLVGALRFLPCSCIVYFALDSMDNVCLLFIKEKNKILHPKLLVMNW
ncbi:hypothetical protein AMTR_s00069p00131090 [Amborella trichopoda]|uniref:Uncharacterized protein n=1 Tax=Amborella trichopoda TaxID=13333 RepID=U5DA36_AMBTC|nr:hypothetical protein AMTR_s00069p00131090 [Amborella trichopoda]